MRFGEKQNLFEAHAGITTGDNEYFLRVWFEIGNSHIYRKKQDENVSPAWYFHHKGGNFRKWYGNMSLVLHYDANSINEMKSRPGFRHDGKDFYFRKCATWNKTGTGNICVRYSDDGNTFNTGGCCLFTSNINNLFYAIGLLNSRVMDVYLGFLCPTFSFAAGDVEKIPVVFRKEWMNEISERVKENIDLSKNNWDSFETSWDFMVHPLVRCKSFSLEQVAEDVKHNIVDMNYVEEAVKRWSNECYLRFQKLKENEEELNRIFIDIYGLQNELTPEVEDKDVTVHRVFENRDEVPDSMKNSNYTRTYRDEIVSLLSYAVGCMFGRYSLDKEGLIYAGGDWKSVQDVYKTLLPDQDNVIPITDQKYLDDDVVERICEFLTVVYGAETLEENLDFIAEALGNKGLTSREVIRNYMLNDFFKDHCKTYSVTGSGKRPIYWLFDSGKENAFKALVYMHRWDADTTGRVLLYAQQIQQKYETEIRAIDMMLDHITDARQKSTEEKRQEHLKKQLEELVDYKERLEHMANERIAIDLDDGVKVNYEKVQTDRNGKKYRILAPIK